MPRISRLSDFETAAKEAGFSPMPHQRIAAAYFNATKRARWLYSEIADIEPRQNGKSSKLVPLITSRLVAGSKVMHTAQNRALPREVFLEVANVMRLRYWSLLDGSPQAGQWPRGDPDSERGYIPDCGPHLGRSSRAS